MGTINAIVHAHPEWKRLYEGLVPITQLGQEYKYALLSDLAGVNVRSARGRRQFKRCAREILLTHQVHFENVRNEGYRAVLPVEHSGCALNRMKRARSRLRDGIQILTNTQLDKLTDGARRAHADLTARHAKLLVLHGEEIKGARKLVAEVQQRRLPSPTLDALEAVTAPAK